MSLDVGPRRRAAASSNPNRHDERELQEAVRRLAAALLAGGRAGRP